MIIESEAATRARSLESLVLVELTSRQPQLVAEEELIRAVAVDPDDFAERDEFHLAVRGLAAHGLVDRLDKFVVPTRAGVWAAEAWGCV